MDGNDCKMQSKDVDDDSWKVCPRCRTIVEKMDDGCDHMICACCRYEFCWCCLADRSVIFAHGNHHHRPTCKWYSPYAGRDEFLPQSCVKCAIRGCACRPPGARGGNWLPHLSPGALGERSAALVDDWMRWFQ